MKKSLLFLTLLLLNFNYLFSQCPDGIYEPPGYTCAEATVVCAIQDLDDYCLQMTDVDSPGDDPTPLCPNDPPGITGPQNIHWFRFTAATNQITVELNITNCVAGFDDPGVQYGIYTDCSYQEALICQSLGPTTGLVTFSSDQFIPGNKYFVFVDGWAGSYCTVFFSVIDGGGVYEVEDPVGIDEVFDGSIFDPPLVGQQVCLGGSIDFGVQAEDSNDGINYNWTIDPPTAQYPDGIIDATGFSSVNVDFTEINTYQICGNAYSDCDTSIVECTTVEVVQVADDILDDYYVCTEDLPVTPPGWLGPPLNAAGSYMINTEDPTFSCDYIQRIEVFEYPTADEGVVEDLVCNDGSPVNYLICGEPIIPGQNPDVPEVGVIQCENADFNGCDSLVNYTVSFINVISNLMEPECFAGNLLFTWFGIVPNPVNGRVITYNLYRDSDLILSEDAAFFNISNTPFIVNLESGNYVLEIVVEQFGKTCTFSSDPISVDAEELLPAAPELGSWVLNPCIQDSITYALDPTSDPSLNYLWTVSPPGGLNVFNNNTNQIGVGWSGADPNQTYTICVLADNGCGLGPVVCEDINLLDQPEASWDGPDTICISNTATIEYDGISLTGADYNWNFGGGDIGAADPNSPGSFDVEFSTTGKKIISLSVDQGTCSSQIFIDSIEVVAPLAPPVINCGSTSDSIGFSWPDLADGYIINIVNQPGGATVDQGNNFINFTNLNPLDEVEIEVIAVDNGVCNDVSNIITCTALNCPPVSISIENVDTICLDANAGTIDLTASADPSDDGAIIQWSGPGVVDDINGIFDPSVANPGVHTIVYSYTTTCPYSESITIVVQEQPVSSFAATDTICINDAATINYTGTFSNGSFNWDFDGGTASGTNTSPGNVSWSTPGLKTISAVVGNGECLSESFTETVLVQEELVEPEVTCDPQTNDITFTWDNVVNATDYEVIINGDSQGNQSGTSYFVDGLEPGNVVEIVVIANSNNLCGNVSTFLECEAALCPPVVVNINSPVQTFCLSSNSSPVQLVGEALGGEPEADLTWTGPGVDNNGMFNPIAAGVGEHEIILNYEILNCSESDTILLTVNPTPVASFTSQESICVTDTFLLEFNGVFDVDAEFDWTTSGGIINGSGTGPYLLSYNTPGEYEVTLVLDEYNCESSEFTQVLIVEPELEMPDPGFNCIPSTNSIVFEWPDVPCASEYIIFVDGGQVATQSNTEYEVTGLQPEESVDFEIIAISDCACGDAFFNVSCAAEICPTVTVELEEVPSICLTDDITQISITANITGDSGNELQIWDGPGVGTDGVFDPRVAGEGLHTVELLLTTGSCTYTDEIQIQVNPTPDAEVFFTDPTCPGEVNGTMTVVPEGGDGDYEIFINGNNATGLMLDSLSGGSYNIEVVDGQGCSYSESISLVTPQESTLDIDGFSNVIFGDTSSYSLNTNILNDNITNITWADTSGSILCQGVNCTNVVLSPEVSTTVCAFVEYGNGCNVEDCIDIRVERIRRVFIPNIFSPNDDGINDIFYINPNEEITSMPMFQVFNRWGEKMFEQVDVPLDGTGPAWDGNYKGMKLNPGVYVYQLFVVYKDGTPETITGDITIMN